MVVGVPHHIPAAVAERVDTFLGQVRYLLKRIRFLLELADLLLPMEHHRLFLRAVLQRQ